MATGLEIRAQIDTEVARGLALLNGGAAVALLALIPPLLDRLPEYSALSRATFFSLFALQVGLVLAVLHNRFRRSCSLRYEQAGATSPAGHPDPCTIFGWHVGSTPCPCIWVKVSLWGSLALFIGAGLNVCWHGLQVIG
jgi:hypothetical protein